MGCYNFLFDKVVYFITQVDTQQDICYYSHMPQEIKIGVIGTGRLGNIHSRIYSEIPHIKLVGVCDTNLWRAQYASWAANTVAVREHQDLLKKVDAVVIAVPTPMHLQVGLAALEKGVHALIEKPLASNLAEAEALIQFAEKHHCVLQVGHVERFNPAVLDLKQMISSGKLAPEKLVGKTISLEQSIDALVNMDRFETAGVTVVTAF